jgi:hypothetical protein
MRTRVVLAVAILAAVASTPAHGGGWWNTPQVEPATVAVGQRVLVRATVTAASAQELRELESYRVYLIRGFDRSILERAWRQPGPRHGKWWKLGTAEAIEVSRLSSSPTGGFVRASLRLPDLPVGRYAVMLCDLECTRPFGDTIPRLGFTVVADAATARLARALGHVRERLGNRIAQLGETRAELRRDSARLDRLAGRTAELRREMTALHANLVAARSDAADAQAAEPLLGLNLLLLLGAPLAALVAALVWMRRHRRPDPWDASLAHLLTETDRPDARDQSIVK